MADDNAKTEEREQADKPQAEREHAEGKEVFVTKDDSGITAVAEDEDAADPRVTTDVGESNKDEDKNDNDSSGDDNDES